MLRFLARLLAWFRRKPTVIPVVAQMTLGVVAHRWSGVELDGLVALGCTHVRITFYTQDAQEAKDSWLRRLADLDAAGIEPLIVVHDFPTLAEVPSVMAYLTSRFPGRLWQVGNEYDAQPWRKQNPGWQGWTDSGASYATLMYQVIAACPGQHFVGMGLAGATAEIQQYLRDYLAAGGLTLDAWCIHTYGCPIDQSRAQATHAVLLGKMPLWVTEFGQNKYQIEQAWGPNLFPEREVAKQLSAYLTNAPQVGIARAYVYCYYDGVDDGPSNGFGLVRPDESHRPSWDVLHRALQ